MFAGHLGVALAIGRAERRVNVGVFIGAALLLDVLLWLFVLFGYESVIIPVNFAITHQVKFIFPYSHSLLASVLWSTTVGAVAFLCYPCVQSAKWRIATLIAIAVFSHWLLDVIVHQPELPLAGSTSPMIGLGLWQSMPVALVVEAIFVVVGLALFLPGSGLPRGKSIGLGILSIVILAFTVAGMTIAPPPPSAFAMAGSSLVTLATVCTLAWWFGSHPRNRQA